MSVGECVNICLNDVSLMAFCKGQEGECLCGQGG